MTCGGDSGDGGVAESAETRPYCVDGTGTGSGVVVVVFAAAVVVVGGGDGFGGADGSDGTRSPPRTVVVLPRRSTRTANGHLSAVISCTRARPPGHQRHVGRAPS